MVEQGIDSLLELEQVLLQGLAAMLVFLVLLVLVLVLALDEAWSIPQLVLGVVQVPPL